MKDDPPRATHGGQQEGGRVTKVARVASHGSEWYMVRWEAGTGTDLQTRRNGSTATVRRRSWGEGARVLWCPGPERPEGRKAWEVTCPKN